MGKRDGIRFHLLLWGACLGIFLLALFQLEQDRADLGRQQLEEAVRRSAVACYAQEGFYPASVDYLCRNYGLVYSEEAYIIHYEWMASNWMPEITVLERGS